MTSLHFLLILFTPLFSSGDLVLCNRGEEHPFWEVLPMAPGVHDVSSRCLCSGTVLARLLL